MFDYLNARAVDGDAVAVIDARGTYSFQQLRAHVARAVETMKAIEPRADVVVIYGSHGLGIYVSVLAALAATTRIVFVDPATPISFVDHIIRAFGASMLVDCSGSPDNVASTDVEVIDIERDVLRAPTVGESHPCLPLKPSCADYAILTSGTTGEPKVILQSIASLAAHIRNYAGYLGVRPGDRVLQLASAGWDAGLMDIFMSLQRGCTLCTINPRQHDLDDVQRFIEQHDIDTLHMTVPYFRRLYADNGNRYARPKRLVLGGELMYASDISLFNAVFAPLSALYNAYGPTECTTALYARHEHGPLSLQGSWPLARSVEGVSVSLLTDDGKVSTPYVVGELIIHSELLAKRFDMASQTSVEIIAKHPIVDGGYYPTGDLAYYDDDGRIVIAGRKDSVIKVNGQKVSLHEVDATLRGLDDVKDACALAIDEDEEKQILAAIVPMSELTNSVDLRRRIARQLPGHKVPKHFLMLPALPLNKNNKVDRAAILAAFKRDSRLPLAEGSSPLQQEISRVLGGAPVATNLSFLENGGDSLRALQLITALRRKGFQLGLDQLLSDTPIQELSLLTGDAVSGPRERTEVSSSFLPTFQFLITRGIPDLNGWCQTCVLDCSTSVGVEKIVAVVRGVLMRHVSEWAGSDWRIEHAADDATIEEAVEATEARISLVNQSIVSVTVVPRKIASQVVISCHQFYVDRYSWVLLLSELADGTDGDPKDIASWSSAPQYSNWVGHYRDTLARARASDFWSGLPWTHCNASRVGPERAFPPREKFKRKTSRLGLLKVPARHGVSNLARMSELLLASILTGLATCEGNAHQKIHILDSGRDLIGASVETHSTFGWFTIIFPLVMRVCAADLPQTVKQVADYLVRAKPIAHSFGNEFFGRAETQRGVGIYDCDASYNFLGDIEMSASGDWVVNAASLRTLHGAPSHHLEFTGYLSHRDLVLTMDYDGAVYDDGFVEALQSAIAQVLEPMRG
ncbi:AMP-binding protein [Bradyrhizobium sp. USDA 336]|uniref:AMP-binding protein n=1 Tax=Bradyrhizobium sp. USDA 336 TaxID=3156311 RepID=UPI0038364646